MLEKTNSVTVSVALGSYALPSFYTSPGIFLCGY